jgi:hypothetical protein
VLAPRWDWWAPTVTREVALCPAVSFGGAEFVGPPWQLLQVRFSTSTTPLMCRVGSRKLRFWSTTIP